jgi:hypothetical protein
VRKSGGTERIRVFRIRTWAIIGIEIGIAFDFDTDGDFDLDDEVA